ncbi:CAIB/BAIF family protein [Coniochaeta ligniaria NRRL 30616]|uniref:CAIB/BAIF family protein n=1 Tax=Coniochaeta ligniaria NRRL 30616 TaxID=1408157 RepID=A0A1J7I5S8_9PEZI|nr:CAIB/BAIF family protein [Coniochaeta ligniaria NRRL 30616]
MSAILLDLLDRSRGGAGSMEKGETAADQLPIYSPKAEARRILDTILQFKKELQLPEDLEDKVKNLEFTTDKDQLYFPIPVKETETTAALKAVEGLVASCIADLRFGKKQRRVEINLEATTCFLFQTYLSKIDGLGKYSPGVKAKLKDTDLLQAQSDPYRRMSANLYATKTPNAYFHIHGSLEANTTLAMIGLPPFRPDLKTIDAISNEIESHVQQFTIKELELMNKDRRQAGVSAMTYGDFVATPHGQVNSKLPPWAVTTLETETPPAPFSPIRDGERPRILQGIKVLELCRIIAGPCIGRILAEYGADVLKITSPNLPDVPWFQVDVNMGKHAAELDLKTPEGRQVFEKLLEEADVVLDGYRPGAIEKLGYGPQALVERGIKRGKGYVYVNENCFGYEGEWAYRAGWQQIADCVTGIAWAQGAFMGLNEPVIPPFPISDYGTGVMGGIAALTALYHRATKGGSYHAKASLIQYDLLLFKVGQYDEAVKQALLAKQDEEFLKLRHNHSVDQISGTVLNRMQELYPELFGDESPYKETWYSTGYNATVSVVKGVAKIEGVDNSFTRACRPNGTDEAAWNFQSEEGDRRLI